MVGSSSFLRNDCYSLCIEIEMYLDILYICSMTLVFGLLLGTSQC